MSPLCYPQPVDYPGTYADFQAALSHPSRCVTGKYTLRGIVFDFSFERIQFRDCRIIGGSLAGSVFANCTFVGVMFDNVSLAFVEFRNCVIENTRCVGSSLATARFIGCSTLPSC